MAKTATKDPKTRILDAAEKAFAELGFQGASLRDIVGEARVNLATVYYYFRSKEGLMAAVFNRRFDPLRQQNLELLKKCESEAKDGPLPVERIIESMIRPVLHLAATAPGKSQIVMRLIGRIVTEPNEQTQELLRNEFADVRETFLSALQRSLPGLPLADLRWRYQFFWGALAFTLSNPRTFERGPGACNPADHKTVLSQMVGCFAPAFRAPGSLGQKRNGSQNPIKPGHSPKPT